MKKCFQKPLAAGLGAILLLASLTGCGTESSAESSPSQSQASVISSEQTNCPEDKPDNPPDNGTTFSTDNLLQTADAAVVTDFAVRLFAESLEPSKNTLISPLSVLNALAMTANGAEGETLSQMETLFGSDLSSLCNYLSAYHAAMPSAEKYRFHNANSIWIRDDQNFTVEQDFLQTNQNLFEADIFKSTFDRSAVKDINDWVSKNTDRMIPDILDVIPSDAVMYLVNALAFEAEWQDIYFETQISDHTFTMEDGTIQNAKMMYSKEHSYLQDENAQGFLKYYADGKYAFAVLLPDEGISVEDYVNSLTGERLHQLLENSTDTAINAAIPKFETEYSVEMNDILETMGMTDAFDSVLADFSGISASPMGNLFISRVLHKTYIAVNERGTKAGAATLVEMRATGAAPEEIKTVYLDRPFIYMIIDCEEKLPIFIGTVMHIE